MSRVTFSGCFFYRPRRLSLVEHRSLASRRWVHHGTRCYIVKNMPPLDAEIVREIMNMSLKTGSRTAGSRLIALRTYGWLSDLGIRKHTTKGRTSSSQDPLGMASHISSQPDDKCTSIASLLHLADVRFRKVVVDQQPVMTSKDPHECGSRVECDTAKPRYLAYQIQHLA